jgi:triacylglycerol lipase
MRLFALVLAGAMLLAGCSHAGSNPGAVAPVPVRFEQAPGGFAAVDPAPEHKPAVLLVHGHGGTAHDWDVMVPRLQAAGFDPHAITLATDDWAVPALAQQLAVHVEALLKTSGQDRIDVVAHSYGGIVVRYYLNHLGGLAKVRRLVCLAVPNHGVGPAALGPWVTAARTLNPLGSFLKELNAGDETPGDLVYTCVWSTGDYSELLPLGSCRLKGAYCYRTKHINHPGMIREARLMPTIIEGLRRAPGGIPGPEQEI